MKKLFFLVLLFTSKVLAYDVYINNHLYPKGNMQCKVSDWVTVPYKPFMQFYEAGYSNYSQFSCYIRDEANNLAITTFNETADGCSADIFRNHTSSNIVGFCSIKNGNVYLGFSRF